MVGMVDSHRRDSRRVRVDHSHTHSHSDATQSHHPNRHKSSSRIVVDLDTSMRESDESESDSMHDRHRHRDRRRKGGSASTDHRIGQIRTDLLACKLRYRELKSGLQRSRANYSRLERQMEEIRVRRVADTDKKHEEDLALLSSVHLHGPASSSKATAALAATAAVNDAVHHERSRHSAEREAAIRVELQRENLTIIRTQNALLEIQSEYTRMKRDLRASERAAAAADARRDDDELAERLEREQREEEEKYPIPPPPIPPTTINKSAPFITTHTATATATAVMRPHADANSHALPAKRSSRSRHPPIIQVVTHTDSNDLHSRRMTVSVSPDRNHRIDKKVRLACDGGKELSAVDNEKLVDVQITAAATSAPASEAASSSTLAFDSSSPSHVNAIIHRLNRNEAQLADLRSAVGIESNGGGRIELTLTPRSRHRTRHSRARSDGASPSSSSSSSSSSSPARLIIHATAIAPPASSSAIPLPPASGGSDGRATGSSTARKSSLKRRTIGLPPPKKAPLVLPGEHRAFMTHTSNSILRQREMIDWCKMKERAYVRPKVIVSQADSYTARRRGRTVSPASKKRAASAAPPSVREERPITLRLELQHEPGRRRASTPPPPASAPATHASEVTLEQRIAVEEDFAARRAHAEYLSALEARSRALEARDARRRGLQADIARLKRDRQRRAEEARSISPVDTIQSLSPISSTVSLTPRTPDLPTSPPSPTRPTSATRSALFPSSPRPHTHTHARHGCIVSSGSLASDPFPATSPLPYGSPSSTAHLLALHARKEFEEEEQAKERHRRSEAKRAALVDYRAKLESHYARVRARAARKAAKLESRLLADAARIEEARAAELTRLRSEEHARLERERSKLEDQVEEWKKRCQLIETKQKLKQQQHEREKERLREERRRRREAEARATTMTTSSVCITSTPSRDKARIVIDTASTDAAAAAAAAAASDDAARRARLADARLSDELHSLERQRLVDELELARARQARERLADVEEELYRRRAKERELEEQLERTKAAEERNIRKDEARRERERRQQRRIKKQREEEEELRRLRRSGSPSSISARERDHHAHAAALESQLASDALRSSQRSQLAKDARYMDLVGGIVAQGPTAMGGIRPYAQPLSAWQSHAYPTSAGMWPSVAAYNGAGGIGQISGAPYPPMPIVGGGQVYPYYTQPLGDPATSALAGAPNPLSHPMSSAAPLTGGGSSGSTSGGGHHSYIVDASSLGPLKPGDLIFDPVKQQYVEVEEEVQVHVAPGAAAPVVPLPQATQGPYQTQTSQTGRNTSVAALIDKLHSSVQQVQPTLWNAGR